MCDWRCGGVVGGVHLSPERESETSDSSDIGEAEGVGLAGLVLAPLGC